ncbi:MAG: CpaF family protein [Deltaproteobacteria bacterium]|nr:CpaF family protein [Deltaproteobacteria bacterium]
MALLDRLKGSSPSPTATKPVNQPTNAKRAPAAPGRDAQYQDLKSRVHNRLFDVIDFARISTVSEERVCSDIATATLQILEDEKFLLTLEERERFVKEIQDEVFGLGPLEPLLQDPTISDILVNGSGHIFIERRGKLEKTVARFRDDAHLMRIIDKIVSAVGRRIDESSPLVDARLADGSRVNVIIPPLALDGPAMSIRRFGTDPLTVENLIELGALTPELVKLLEAIVACRLNVLISGGTGSGKTTLLNVVSSFIPADERIVTIEDSAELQLKQEHVVRLETRPANIEGTGRIAQRDLVINSLRMRPDRIVVGEVRGAESLDMLQAMNTGHDGSLTTVHANTPRDALSRIETMVAMAGLDMPQRSVRSQIASAINVVVQLARLSDGRRKLVSLQEITGMEGEIVTMQEIFTFDRHGIDADNNVLGEIVPTGVRPKFAEKLKLAGYPLPASLFERHAR